MRQVNEPVRMMKAKSDCLLNSKSEFHQGPGRQREGKQEEGWHWKREDGEGSREM